MPRGCVFGLGGENGAGKTTLGEPITGVIVGSTATGRATLARLQMNKPIQLAARQQWRRLRLFPPA